jgi:glycosyltransferase involved in cell wall biosynthesis
MGDPDRVLIVSSVSEPWGLVVNEAMACGCERFEKLDRFPILSFLSILQKRAVKLTTKYT